MNNPSLNTDGYKIDHRRQYPEGTSLVYSNMTARKSRREGVNDIVVYGIQPYLIGTLIEMWNRDFFQQPFEVVGQDFYDTMVDYTSKDVADSIGIEHMRALHKLGYLPLEIKAIPEGTLLPIKCPIFTVKNTLPEFYWLTNYIETDMSSETWGPITSATTAFQYRQIFTAWAKKTGAPLDFIPFQGHDFSYRGMFGREAAKMSGAGHLTSFFGTDTVPALGYIRKYYKTAPGELIGTSVFATEHAVMCVSTGFFIKRDGLTWEKYGDAELAVFKRLITELYPSGIVSVVSDTWDLWKVLLEYIVILKDEILARDGKLVIRPDSGDPVQILCGTTVVGTFDGVTPNYAKPDATEAEIKGVVELLWDVFGGTTNEAGYRFLDPHIGCIYGDSITTERANEICARLANKMFGSTNWVAGIGSYTYQYVTRDTFGMAMKATYAEVDMSPEELEVKTTVGIEVFKDPKTDDGTKKSARGLVSVQDENGKPTLHDQQTWEQEATGLLQTVFLDGKLTREFSFQEIRESLLQY